MRFAVLLHEDGHIARDYHIDGLSHLQKQGEVDLFKIKSGHFHCNESRIHSQFSLG